MIKISQNCDNNSSHDNDILVLKNLSKSQGLNENSFFMFTVPWQLISNIIIDLNSNHQLLQCFIL